MAETSGLLNRRRGYSPTEGSNPSVSASSTLATSALRSAFDIIVASSDQDQFLNRGTTPPQDHLMNGLTVKGLGFSAPTMPICVA